MPRAGLLIELAQNRGELIYPTYIYNVMICWAIVNLYGRIGAEWWGEAPEQPGNN